MTETHIERDPVPSTIRVACASARDSPLRMHPATHVRFGRHTGASFDDLNGVGSVQRRAGMASGPSAQSCPFAGSPGPTGEGFLPCD